MKIKTFIKRFGKEHPALMTSFFSGITTAKNGKMYTLHKTKRGEIIAKKIT